MTWQASEMTENGTSCGVAQMDKSNRYQYLRGQKVFAVAPMMDWTDRHSGIDYPQFFSLKRALAQIWHSQLSAVQRMAHFH